MICKDSFHENCDEGSSVKTQLLAATICSFLTMMYGQSVGWTSSAVTRIEAGILSDGPISTKLLGWLGGAFCLGGLLCAPFIGLLADARGRKFTAYLIGIFFTINWTIILCTNTYYWVLVARVFAGMGAGGSVTIVSIYNNEIAELKSKSAIGGILALAYVFGIETSYILGAYLQYRIIAIVYLCFCLIWFPVWWTLPETPAHLVLHGQEKSALSAIQWLRGINLQKAKCVLDYIRNEQEGAVNSASIKEFFQDPAARKGIFIVGLIMAFQTFCGAMAVNVYAASIFGKAGGGLTAESGVMIYGATMIVGAVIPPLLANRAPRNVLLCLSTFLMACGMITFGTIQMFKSWMTPEEEEAYSSILPPIVLSVTIFTYFFGFGSIPYMTATELFSDENRGVAGALVSVVLWSTSFILLQFYGSSVEIFGDYIVFYFFACILFICFFFVIICLPETRGRSFPEIKKMLLKN